MLLMGLFSSMNIEGGIKRCKPAVSLGVMMLNNREKGILLLLLLMAVVLPMLASVGFLEGTALEAGTWRAYLVPASSLLLIVWLWGVVGPLFKLIMTMAWRAMQPPPPPRLKQAEVIL